LKRVVPSVKIEAWEQLEVKKDGYERTTRNWDSGFDWDLELRFGLCDLEFENKRFEIFK